MRAGCSPSYVTHPLKKGYRTIRLPLAESEYDRFLSDRAYVKARLDELYEDCPAVFPEAFPWGYALYGFTEPSCKQHLRCRRIGVPKPLCSLRAAAARVPRAREVLLDARRRAAPKPLVADQAA